MSLTAKLEELGINLPEVATPLGAYRPAVLDGDHVLTSGQLPMVDGALKLTGIVGTEVSVEDAKDAARTCALNALAAAAQAAGGLDNLGRVVKVTGFVASEPTFTGQPAVLNGASEFFGEVFGEDGVHARSAVGVAALPANSPVEVEVTFALR